MAKFITIGERISVTALSIRKAFAERDPEPREPSTAYQTVGKGTFRASRRD